MKLRYCLYCQCERDATTFTVLVHKKTGVKKYRCASCMEAYRARSADPNARERSVSLLLQRNQQAKRAWAQRMLQAREAKK